MSKLRINKFFYNTSSKVLSHLFRSEGQAVIEAVIALSALLILLAAIAIVITTSLSNTTFSNNQDVANKRAQEGIEIVRGFARSNSTIDELNVTLFSPSMTGPFCMGDDGSISLVSGGGATPRDGCGVNVDDAFVRTVEFTQELCGGQDFDGVEANVEVAWSSGKCTCDDLESCSITDRYCHTASLVSCFGRPQPNSQL